MRLRTFPIACACAVLLAACGGGDGGGGGRTTEGDADRRTDTSSTKDGSREGDQDRAGDPDVLGKQDYRARLVAAQKAFEARQRRIADEFDVGAGTPDVGPVLAGGVDNLGQLADDLQELRPSDPRMAAAHSDLIAAIEAKGEFVALHIADVQAGGGVGALERPPLKAPYDRITTRIDRSVATLSQAGWAPAPFFIA